MNPNANPELLKGEEGNTGQCQGRADLSFLEGKTVVRTGYVPGASEGGFAIDYDDAGTVRRVVFGYNDLGFWIQWHGQPGADNPEDVLKRKVEDAWDELCIREPIIATYPLERRYAFVNEGGVPILSLTLGELKLMGENVTRHFGSLPLDAEKILMAISGWAF